VNLISLQPGETVRSILNVRNLEEEGKYVFFATRKATVKKVPLKDFSNVNSRGIIAIGIDEGDELVTARITDGKKIVFLASHEGMAVRFEESDVRPMGRPAYGVRGMDLAEKDYIVGMAVTEPGGAKKTDGKKPAETEEKTASSLILSVTENGFGKRTQAEEYRLIWRGGKGVRNVKTTEKTGKVTAIMQVEDDSECMIISQYGKIIRIPNDQIRETLRAAQGVRLLQLEPGDRVAAAVVIPPEEKAENGGLLQ
jgi:DNA gyrase subunit A